jgi:hypothetical protein
MRHIGIAVSTALALFAGLSQSSALAQSVGSTLMAQKLGDIPSGQYRAGDRMDFALVENGDRYLLKFADQNEIFVLTASRGTGGGRVLKYDTGAVALQVAGFGGLTLYPDDAPAGLPAERAAEAPKLAPEPVTLQQMTTAAESTGKALNIVVVADWDYMNADAAARSIGLEALENFEHGVARFIRQRGRATFAQHIDTVRLQPNFRASLVLAGKTLMIGFNQAQGLGGRLSSRAVAQTLDGLISK